MGDGNESEKSPLLVVANETPAYSEDVIGKFLGLLYLNTINKIKLLLLSAKHLNIIY